MSDKDPPPFGYTFGTDFFNGSLDTHGQSLLSDMEGQSLADFFSNTDPFNPSDSQLFASAADTKLAGDDFSDWNFMAPPTVHQVSATVPDQAQLHHGFHSDNMFATQPHHLPHMATTHDDLQAASTLFNNAQQPAYMADRSHSLHDTSSSSHSFHDTSSSTHPSAHSSTHPSTHPSKPLHHPPKQPHVGAPMVATSQGPLNEQLAALLPNHASPGTLDAQLAAHWVGSNVHEDYDAQFGALLRRPSLKRTYTFGTDNAFSNPAAFSAPNNESEEQVTRRLMYNMHHDEAYITDPPTSTARALPTPVEDGSEDDSEETSSADDGQPTKKRKKSTHVKKEAIRKTTSGTRVSKSKKPAIAEDSKKKRASAAAQKLQRENLSEEQKRSNHILSEQKRRNLIKRGFDDLHDLVPEIRKGGLSKSSVLMEAANFLDKLIEDNQSLLKLMSGVSDG